MCLRRHKNLHKEKISMGLYSVLNLIMNGGNVEFGLRDTDLVYHCKINNVLKQPKFSDWVGPFCGRQTREGMSTALNCTRFVYSFEFQVSKLTASTVVTLSWFIPVLGRYQFF